MELILDGGTIVDQRFEIFEQIGTGGMGCVFRAKQIGLEREVAIKFLQVELLNDSEFCRRFEREAHALSQLSHQHVGAFYSYGIWNTKIPYIAMELLEGTSLNELLQQTGPLDWRRAAAIISQACDAMQHAHDGGIVHRDLKPSNIILQEGDCVKVMDFGLSKLSSEASDVDKLTKTGFLIGSVDYMSPEQCKGRPADNKSDIYSLGCVFYECITGRPPHEAENPIGLLHKHTNENIELASKRLGKKLPPGLDELLLKALAKDPSDRYQSMSEMRKDINKVMVGTGSRIQVPESLRNNKTAVEQSKIMFAGICTICLLAAAGTFIVLNKQKKQSPETLYAGPRLSAAKVDKLLDEALADFKLSKLESSMNAVEKVLAAQIKPTQRFRALQYHAIIDSSREDHRAAAIYWKKTADFCQEQSKNLVQSLDWNSAAATSRSHYITAMLIQNLDGVPSELNKLQAECSKNLANEELQRIWLQANIEYFAHKGVPANTVKFLTEFAKQHPRSIVGLEALLKRIILSTEQGDSRETQKARVAFLQQLRTLPSTADPSNVLIEVAQAYDDGNWHSLLSQCKKIRSKTDSWTVQNECYLLFSELNIANKVPVSKERLTEMQHQLRQLVQNCPLEECTPGTIPVPLVLSVARLIKEYSGTASAFHFLDQMAELVTKKDMDTPEFAASITIEKASLSPKAASASTIAELKEIVNTPSYKQVTQALALYSLSNVAISKGAYEDALNLLNLGIAKISYLRQPSLVTVLLLRAKGQVYEHLKDLDQADKYYLESLKVNDEITPEGASKAVWRQNQKSLIEKSFLRGNKHTKLLHQMQQI